MQIIKSSYYIKMIKIYNYENNPNSERERSNLCFQISILNNNMTYTKDTINHDFD
jgi:hypothetical protein